MKRSSFSSLSLTSLLALLFVGEAFGAACCGSTSNVPSLISGDNRSQITAALSHGSVVSEATVEGEKIPRKTNDHEISQTLKLDAATLLSDRLQAGFTLPITKRARNRNGADASATGLGDISVGAAYEILPEWSYSTWRPKGFLFFQATLPTGGSTYDATELFRIDSRGRGFTSLGAGTLFVKTWGSWDALLLLEGHRSLPRSLENPAGKFELVPGWGVSASVGLGFTPSGSPIRIGTALAASHEDAVETRGDINAMASPQRLWTASLQASYMVEDDLSANLVYSDQTLLGNSANTSLSRTVSVMLQKRWDR